MPCLACAHALVLALLPAVPAQGQPSALEAEVAAWVEGHEEEGLQLLERLVNVNSGTMNAAGVTAVGAMLAEELEALAFTTRWIDGAAFERAGHLLAERAGSGDGLHVLLIGHLDTVFEPDSPFQRFARLDADRVRGPGTTDMKGGNVVMLLALGALAEIGALDELTVTVVLTGDEEDPGRPLDLARRDLVAAGKAADIALGFEDGDGDPATAVVARRGSASWHLEVAGTPAHSSQIFQESIGAGAIYEAGRILEAFRQVLAEEKDLTHNPGLILGGTQVDVDAAQSRGIAFGKNNVIAERAVVTGDLRALSPEQLARARGAMEEVVAAGLPGTEARFELSDGYPPMAASDGNRRLLALYDQVSRDLGHGPVAPVDPRNAGAADISFVAADVAGALDGLGLMGTGGHTVEETADLATLVSQAQRAAVLMLRLAGGAWSG